MSLFPLIMGWWWRRRRRSKISHWGVEANAQAVAKIICSTDPSHSAHAGWIQAVHLSEPVLRLSEEGSVCARFAGQVVKFPMESEDRTPSGKKTCVFSGEYQLGTTFYHVSDAIWCITKEWGPSRGDWRSRWMVEGSKLWFSMWLDGWRPIYKVFYVFSGIFCENQETRGLT